MMKKINVIAKANARKNEVIKVSNDVFKVFTTSTPENGKANKSIIELLSVFFRIGKTKIKIVSGKTSKNKIFELSF